MMNGYGLITCGVSDMPSTGSVSIFYSLSVFSNFSLLSHEVWVKKSNFAAHTNLLGLFCTNLLILSLDLFMLSSNVD
jgi:hypothetical protein